MLLLLAAGHLQESSTSQMLLRVASRPSRFICKACRVSLNQSRKRKFGTNSITSNPEEIYDVVTVGGGPVGLALLTALSMYTAFGRGFSLTQYRIITSNFTSEMRTHRSTTASKAEIMGASIRPVLESREQHHSDEPIFSRSNRSMEAS